MSHSAHQLVSSFIHLDFEMSQVYEKNVCHWHQVVLKLAADVTTPSLEK